MSSLGVTTDAAKLGVAEVAASDRTEAYVDAIKRGDLVWILRQPLVWPHCDDAFERAVADAYAANPTPGMIFALSAKRVHLRYGPDGTLLTHGCIGLEFPDHAIFEQLQAGGEIGHASSCSHGQSALECAFQRKDYARAVLIAYVGHCSAKDHVSKACQLGNCDEVSRNFLEPLMALRLRSTIPFRACIFGWVIPVCACGIATARRVRGLSPRSQRVAIQASFYDMERHELVAFLCEMARFGVDLDGVYRKVPYVLGDCRAQWRKEILDVVARFFPHEGIPEMIVGYLPTPFDGICTGS